MPPKKAAGKPEPDVTVPAGDPAAGRDIFEQQCSACHSVEAGGDQKAASAPSLGGVIGRMVGSTDFKYSKGLKTAGFVWSDKHLFVYLRNPAKYITGNRMAFAGLDSDKDRADVIAYLKTV